MGILNSNKILDIPLQKMKAIPDDGYHSLGTGIEVCTYTYDDQKCIDTTYSYDMDGVTLKDVSSQNYSYKQLVKSHCTTPKYRGVAVFNTVFNLIIEHYQEMQSEQPLVELNMTMDGTATIDYYNDDLVLNFNKISCKAENGISTFYYQFTMLNGKYSVVLNGTHPYDYTDEPVDTDVTASGPIILVATGKVVGKFNLLYSLDVQIFGSDGHIIKKTN